MFNGPHESDDPKQARLTAQFQRIFALMRDGAWRTFGDIAAVTNDPAPSISAQLRHMRKRRFGAHTVQRRYLGKGLYEYRLLVRGGGQSFSTEQGVA